MHRVGWLLAKIRSGQTGRLPVFGQKRGRQKGGNFGKALDQIEATLQFLCRQGSGNVIHNGKHKSALAHDAPENGGVRAYVILSHGRKVGLRSRQVEDIRKRFGVRVYAREGVSVNGLDALPDSDK